MEVSFYLKRPNGKESSAIYARICYHSIQLKYYPSMKINPKFWNKTKERAKETNDFPNYKNFNKKLNNIVRYAEDLLMEYQNSNGGKTPPKSKLKEMLDIKLKGEVKEQITFLKYFQQIIDESESGERLNETTGKPINANTIKTYITTKNVLAEYELNQKVKIDFDFINSDFYSAYKKYLIKEMKYATNTIGKHIQIIKLIMGEAKSKKLHSNTDYEDFTVMKEDVESIYLNEKDLKDLEAVDLSEQKNYENARDLFIIGCHTGLRYSDFSILKPENIVDGYIEITQVKTGDKVVIPVHSAVTRIIEKYGGQLPKAYSNQKMNLYIKEAAKKVKGFDQTITSSFTKAGKKVVANSLKHDLISTHTARRSFATNNFLAGIPSLVIMAVTGHKTEKSFMRYIKVTSKEKAEVMKFEWAKHEKIKLEIEEAAKQIENSIINN